MQISRFLLAGAFASVALSPAPASSQAIRAGAATKAPVRVAVGQLDGGEKMTFEARDGWVVLTILPSRPDEGYNGNGLHVIMPPADARDWASKVRQLLSAPFEMVASEPGKGATMTTVGEGHRRIGVFAYKNSPGRWYFWMIGCGPGASTGNLDAKEMGDIAQWVDSTATVAERRPLHLPTLRRAYYANELSCSVLPTPRANLERVATRPVRQAGVRFIVDTLGEVELRSVRTLDGHAPEITKLVTSWRYQAAEWDGTPVRQIVDTVVELPIDVPHDTTSLIATATSDGWVRVSPSIVSNSRRVREWVAPDSVDSWVARVTRAAAIAKRGDTTFADLARLGYEGSIAMYAGWRLTPKSSTPQSSVSGCRNSFSAGWHFIETTEFARLQAAANEARALRATPMLDRDSVYDASDVACTAWMRWSMQPPGHFEHVWSYPKVLYPGAAEGGGAYDEVLTSFVVDTNGVADPRTVHVINGAPKIALAALQAGLPKMRFTPAIRAGVKVKQRVVRSVIVEAPPVCLDRDASPACPRRYSPE